MYVHILSILVLAVAAAVNFGCARQGSANPVPGVIAADVTYGDPRFQDAESLIAKMPDSPAGYNQLALAYIKKARETGDFALNTKADEAIDRALKLGPNDFTARAVKASLHLTFHRFADGLAMGNQLQKEFPRDAFIWGILTDANTELGDYKEAVAAAQQMVDLKPNSSSYVRAAHLRWLHGDHTGAVEMYTLAARTADPADKEAQSWCLTQLGDEYMRAGKYAEAEKTYAEALSISPNYPLALFGSGRAKAASGDLATAITLMSGAVERSPHTGNLLQFGDVLRQSGKTDAAQQIYALADNAEALGDTFDAHRIALFWANNDINLDKALEIAEADYAKIKDIYASDIFAWCLYKKGRFQEAKQQAREALRLGTKDAVLLYHAGMIENALGNRAEAKKLLRSALDLNPAFDLIQADIARKTLSAI